MRLILHQLMTTNHKNKYVVSIFKTIEDLFQWMSNHIFFMEVIIDYYGEEYPCFIYPDRSVEENRVEVAVRSTWRNQS